MRLIWNAALALLLCGGFVFAQSVVIVETFNVPDRPFPWVQGINNRGDMLGAYWAFPGPLKSWVYLNKEFKPLTSHTGDFPVPLGPPRDYLAAQGINDLQQIAGSYKYGAEYGIFIWDGSAYSTYLVDGAALTIATGINNSGAVVGTYGIQGSANVVDHAYVLKNGVLKTIDYPGALGSVAHGINDHGDIVGYYSYDHPVPHSPGGDVQIHGFLYRDGIFAPIDFPGAVWTFAIRVNNRGDIAGFYRDTAGKNHGFVLTGGEYLAVDFPSGTCTIYGLNDHGQVAGTHSYGGQSEGFIAQVRPGLGPESK
jgi:uncharacterized membrane protein